MPAIDVHLDGDRAWPDLPAKVRAGTVIELGEDAKVALASLATGMASGRASVELRLDLPDGRTVLWATSLRALWNAVTTVAAKHGEPFMQSRESEREHKSALALRTLAMQLVDAQRRLGEPATLDLTEADATWDREQQLRSALGMARSALLAGEGLTAAMVNTIDAALVGRKP